MADDFRMKKAVSTKFPKCLEELVGAPGFEPGNSGIKIPVKERNDSNGHSENWDCFPTFIPLKFLGFSEFQNEVLPPVNLQSGRYEREENSNDVENTNEFGSLDWNFDVLTRIKLVKH